FTAGQRRIEYAGHLHVLGAAAQQVLVVLVEDVQGAGLDLVDLAVGDGLDLAVAAHAVHRLQVVLVVDVGLGARVNGGDVEGEAHLVFLQDHPGAVPGLGDNLAFGCFTVFQGTY